MLRLNVFLTVFHAKNFTTEIVNEMVNNVNRDVDFYLLRNAFTSAIESSTNIATVGGKQKWVKEFRLLVISSF